MDFGLPPLSSFIQPESPSCFCFVVWFVVVVVVFMLLEQHILSEPTQGRKGGDCCGCRAPFLQVESLGSQPGMVLPIVGRWLINIIKTIPFQPAQRPISQVIARSVKLTTTVTVPFVWASFRNPWSSQDFIFCSREAPQDTGLCQLTHHLPCAS